MDFLGGPLWLRLLDFGSTAFLSVLLVVLVWRLLMIKDRAHEDASAKFRAQIIDTQREIVSVLSNHLESIAENQAKTAYALHLIVSRLLDAALQQHDEVRQ